MQLPEMMMIDKVSKTRIFVHLKDKDNNEVSIQDITEKLSAWVKDNVTSENENSCQKQIFPMMSNVVLFGLNKIAGDQLTYSLLSQQSTRNVLTYMTTIGFYLSKWLQKNEIKVFTNEEPITDEEIDSFNKINDTSSIISSMSALGYDPKMIVKTLFNTGIITREDLVKLGCEDWIEEKKDEEN